MSDGKIADASWSLVATVVLIIRVFATIAVVLTVLAWVVAAFRNSLGNVWLWPAIGSLIALAVSSWAYSAIRVRYTSADE